MQVASLAFSFALLNAGKSRATTTVITPITTDNSVREKPIAV
jgi:hypothetical protein